MTEFDRICMTAEFGDLKKRNGTSGVSVKRQGVWCKMLYDGFSLSEIASQSDRSHSTVRSGIKRFEDLLFIGDKEAESVWERILTV